jgi:hypothetical protein
MKAPAYHLCKDLPPLKTPCGQEEVAGGHFLQTTLN